MPVLAAEHRSSVGAAWAPAAEPRLQLLTVSFCDNQSCFPPCPYVSEQAAVVFLFSQLLSMVSFCGAGDDAGGLRYGRQAPYHRSHMPIILSLFLRLPEPVLLKRGWHLRVMMWKRSLQIPHRWMCLVRNCSGEVRKATVIAYSLRRWLGNKVRLCYLDGI